MVSFICIVLKTYMVRSPEPALIVAPEFVVKEERDIKKIPVEPVVLKAPVKVRLVLLPKYKSPAIVEAPI